MRRDVPRGRNFDPRRVGELECRAWVTYYRHEWFALLVASVGLIQAGFRMRPHRTLYGAWLVLRANQLWAPPVDNDPDGARRCMQRFYRLVAHDSGETLDTVEAARLEVDWWRAHRAVQTGDQAGDGHQELVDCLVRLYAYLYRCPPEDVTPAANLRVEAMDVSDRWVAEGCDLASPLVAEERALLVRSYASLLSAVHRPPP
ncbi:MAG TPA: hypothetical protein VL337_03415 [Acidimicrobiales bacterium]|nr:hypothetical protein [Acidimicrobiales bacterium]